MTTIVIPTYNERENIVPLIHALFALGISDLSVLVVDDASPDGTGEAVEALRAELPHLELLRRACKQGLGSAYVEGFARVLEKGAGVVVEMDADFSHAPEDVPRLLQAIVDGADVVIGSRRVPRGRIVGWHWRRHVASRGAMWIARMLLRLKTRDVTSGFRAYRRSCLTAIHFADVRSDGYAFQEEMLLRCERGKFIITEVPVTFIDRVHGTSKLGMQEIVNFFITLLRLWIHR
ncbi:MAG: polyprenol monophosphomannose synthase [Patescibacteria group bacterium]